MRKYLPISLLAALVVVTGCNNGGASVSAGSSSSGPLKFNPKLNSPYVYATEAKTTGMAASDTKMTESTVYTSKGAGSFEGVTTITDATATGPASAIMAKIKGTTTTKEVSDRGEVTKTTGSGPLAAMETMNGVGSGIQGVVFPTDALHEGQTWTSTIDLAKTNPAIAGLVSGGNTNIITNFKVTKIAGNTVTIDATTTSSFQTKAGAMSMNGDTTADFDRADGMLVKSDSKSHVKITGTMNMDIETDTTTTKQ